MSALSIQVPFPVFQGRDGQPLENGYVWIGEPNLNPQTNPVVAYYDEALTIVAPQPLRTLNGYISRAGTPAKIYVDGVNFSILVQDSKGSMVYNFPDGSGISPNAAGIEYDPPFTGALTSGYTVQDKLAQTVSVKDFGAVGNGVADDTAALLTALDALDDGAELDLNGLTLKIFTGVVGVTSGDAVPLSQVPRIYQKNNITIKNGTIFAADPSVSGTKYRYPTTFAIDECSDIVFDRVTFESKGQNWGDTDASSGLTFAERKDFAQQNGGHACLIAQSERVTFNSCNFRLAGSVASFYSMSSHDVRANSCFSNPGSLGYAAYAFDSWAGSTAVTGFPAHAAFLTDCSAYKEGYTYGSKGCVLTEDADVTVTVNGGYYADAYPNGTARDIGYAFGCSSSQTIVNGAVVENCAAIGYTGTTNNTAYSYLYISNVHAIGLRKTVHQTEETSVGRMYWKYVNVNANVVGGSTWPSDGNLSREETSYLAMPNAAIRVGGEFLQCTFDGAKYGFISTTSCFGKLTFDECQITTNGFLWDTKNIGSGSAGAQATRGIYFFNCGIEDVSAETSAYTTTVSSTIYTNIDVSTSPIKLASARDIESSTITTPSTFIEKYSFSRNAANVAAISTTETLMVDSAVIQSLEPTGASRSVLLPRQDKYKFMTFTITNTSVGFDLLVKNYLNTVTYATLTPGQSATAWNDGVNNYVRVL